MSQRMWTASILGKVRGWTFPTGGYTVMVSGSLWAESHSGLVTRKEGGS